MRKSVLFLIGVLYLVSVVVVTFFGMQARMDQFKVYITSLEISNENINIDDENLKYAVLRFKQNEEIVSFWVETKIEPSNATNTKLDYILLNSKGEKVSDEVAIVSQLGEIVFLKPVSGISLIVLSTDGSNMRDTLRISCLRAK